MRTVSINICSSRQSLNGFLAFLFVFIALAGLSLTIVQTANAASYAGQVVGIEPKVIEVPSGGAQAVRVQIKNTGTAAWVREKTGYISLYTQEPKYHVSPLRGTSWLNDHQTGKLLEAKIAPGQIGTIELFVHGPQKFTGELSETFQLAAEEKAWVADTKFILKVKVVDEAAEAPATGDEPAEGYGATLLLRSAKTVVSGPNEIVQMRLGFKNSGVKRWTSYELRASDMSIAASDESSLRAPSWPKSGVAMSAAGRAISPGALEFMDFDFRAPNIAGHHEIRFTLVTDGVTVDGSEVVIPVDVTSSAPEIIDTPIDTTPTASGPVRDGDLIEIPRIRVGLAQVNNEVIFNANQDVRVVIGDSRELQTTIAASTPMRAAWNGKQYVFESGGNILLFNEYLRFEGQNADTIFTVTSLDDVRSWNTNLNDNKFRDSLELRFNTAKNRTWLINELPMEYYLYGIDETSNSAPAEYHKAILAAARTYALYMWEHKTKYKGEFIDVRATTYDQVYHGYGAEIRRPNVVAAVDATRGVTVQHDGQTVVAVYSARTDGRSRSWKEVWGKVVPYAVSVPIPCEVGQTKWGHGVGLSMGGALCMAKDGRTFDEILKYFYMGVELVRRW